MTLKQRYALTNQTLDSAALLMEDASTPPESLVAAFRVLEALNTSDLTPRGLRARVQDSYRALRERVAPDTTWLYDGVARYGHPGT